jgi:threonine/homoserine/homoserine lactone efflux protein
MFELFLKGLMIGFAVSAPVGPIGVLCIQRSLHNGIKVGLMTGMGAAIANGTYGLIAGFGLTAITNMLVAQQFWIQTIGGFFLLYLGIKLLIKSPQQQANISNSDKSLWHAFTTSFILTLINPVTILFFMAIFVGVGMGNNSYTGYSHAFLMVLGITLGSALWWFFLSGSIVFFLRHRINDKIMKIINCVSGGIVLVFGLFALRILI